jgi:hypothetical protein
MQVFCGKFPIRREIPLNRYAIAAALLLWPPLAPAWGPLGHQAVGAVAAERLTPRAREQVAALLAADLDADGEPSGRTTLAQVSTWADEIRGSEADRPRWHFDDAPVCGGAQGDGRWCAGGECASRRVQQQLSVLADPRQAPRARNEALKWVVHLVADMHQPLHASDYAQGATKVPVQLAGGKDKRALTLHGAWDVRLVMFALHAAKGGAVPSPALERLLKRADRFDPALVQAPPGKWLEESNELARSVALGYPGFACGEAPPPADHPVVLSREYQRRAEAVVFERLALAGARLAQVLNDALDR